MAGEEAGHSRRAMAGEEGGRHSAILDRSSASRTSGNICSIRTTLNRFQTFPPDHRKYPAGFGRGHEPDTAAEQQFVVPRLCATQHESGLFRGSGQGISSALQRLDHGHFAIQNKICHWFGHTVSCTFRITTPAVRVFPKFGKTSRTSRIFSPKLFLHE